MTLGSTALINTAGTAGMTLGSTALTTTAGTMIRGTTAGTADGMEAGVTAGTQDIPRTTMAGATFPDGDSAEETGSTGPGYPPQAPAPGAG